MTHETDSNNPEQERLERARKGTERWKRWGPYLSERQWGTVREDYSLHGTAWEYLSHNDARMRAYRWGEDGLAGFSDEAQQLCLSLALWNERDPILKERLFGLTNTEGNHGEDVKELYYYLDATPTHSYLRMLYKYPQRPYPYEALIRVNAARGPDDPEYELFDTNVFDDDRYFDVFVEYARAAVDDILMKITVHNRSSSTAALHVIPQACFRNTWNWKKNQPKPSIRMTQSGHLQFDHHELGRLYAAIDERAQALFTDNETNPTLFGEPRPGFFKDAFHRRIIGGDENATHPDNRGTKAGFHRRIEVRAHDARELRLRLSNALQRSPFDDFDRIVRARKGEADRFYEVLQRNVDGAERRRIQRQALAGMIWSKQFFYYDIEEWLNGDPAQPEPPPERRRGRNGEWAHLNNADIISMPDKWEYPWYAAWDLAFHTLPLAMVDPEFAKDQLVLLTREWYMHPNGQIPAYEWAFSDVNPPVHAWAAWRVFEIDRATRGGKGDLAFLERVFHKLLLNFTWWVNRKDVDGRNIFQGGFLGLDNIGVFDRSAPLPTGGRINQADGTSWMAMYSLNLMRIALELACENPVYEDIATKFFEHFLHIARAMTNIGNQGIGLWDPDDAFYYDVLRLDDGTCIPLRLRSLVGIIPLFAVEVLPSELLRRLPNFRRRLEWVLAHKPELASLVSRWHEPGRGETRLLSLLRGHRMKRLLARMLDETEFLSDFGIRGLSKSYADDPYVFAYGDLRMTVEYVPGESKTGLFGGNSNWRGPIWFPVNYLIVESLRRFHDYYGDDFRVECPTGSGHMATLREVSDEVARRLVRIFLPNEDGKRPVLAHHERLARDPHFKDHILFHEYFHGDTGRGVGASHQTGWTGLVAALLSAGNIEDTES